MGMVAVTEEEHKMFFIIGIIVIPLVVVGAIYCGKNIGKPQDIWSYKKVPRETMVISTGMVTPKKSTAIKFHPNKL